MTIRTYSSPEAFKQALEQRLRASAKSGAEFARQRQLLVFDRFLARVFAVLGDAATLKGGLVLELRLERARTTKDVDLRMVGSPDDILVRLQEAGRRDLGDFLSFEVGPDQDHPEIQNDGLRYDGLRFRAECKLAGRVYGQPFGVDVAFGDPIAGPLSDRDAPRREAARVHDGADAPELAGEGSPGHRLARDRATPRREASAIGLRADFCSRTSPSNCRMICPASAGASRRTLNSMVRGFACGVRFALVTDARRRSTATTDAADG